MNQVSSYSKQKGAALFVSLMLLLVITLISVSALRTSHLELKMAGNQESSLSSFMSAQALADAIVATPANVPVIGNPGFTICTAKEAGCNRNTISFANGLFASDLSKGSLGAVVTRGEEIPIPRSLSTSVEKFGGVQYTIQASFDRSVDNLGRTQVVEGMLVLIPRN
ncbi:MAG: hypothetical protein HKN59_06690 [Gammaproteobacteria bacterium]|nr:hypothetical protein [Gammaproteobacteria bacterium]